MNLSHKERSKAKAQVSRQESLQFERERFELEKKKALLEEQKVEIERARLQFEKAKSPPRLTRTLAILAGIVGFLGLIASFGWVMVNWINKEKEIALSDRQKSIELEKLQAQREREWNLSRAQFILTHGEKIFSGTPDVQRLYAKIIPTIFPQEISVDILKNLERTSSPATKTIWHQARTNIEAQPPVKTEAVQVTKTTTQLYDPIRLINANPECTMSGLNETLSSLSALSRVRSDKYQPALYTQSSSFPSLGLDEMRVDSSPSKPIRIIAEESKPVASRLANLNLEILGISPNDPNIIDFAAKGPIAPTTPKDTLFSDGVYRPVSFQVSDPSRLATDIRISITSTDVSAGTPSTAQLLSQTINLSSLKSSVYGLVVDSETGKPVPTAVVSIEEDRLVSSSTRPSAANAAGRFEVEVPYGLASSLKLKISAEGYCSVVKVAGAGGILPLDIGKIALQKAFIQ